jgi:SAM-dependent MidA family methyltransferase
MSYADFVDLALYHADFGYYRRPRTRVGYGSETDFFTARSSGRIFGELVVAACGSLLGENALSRFTFVEIGAEPGAATLAGLAHPFAACRVIEVGAPLDLDGPCVVFSNELFDAQPFRRFVFRGNEWLERMVNLHAEELHDVEAPPASNPPVLPTTAPQGYLIDAPTGASALAEAIAAEPWRGLFLAADYGKSWRELLEACPAGTARAYHRHVQSNDLLSRPGEQDLTCHVCWDWLSSALARNGFRSPTIESQESFFARHAGDFIAREITVHAAEFSQRKLALLQLLHPSHMGQKFQVLHAVRE